MCNNFNKD